MSCFHLGDGADARLKTPTERLMRRLLSSRLLHPQARRAGRRLLPRTTAEVWAAAASCAAAAAGAGASQMDSGTVTTLDDGYCITERYAAAGAIQKVGGLDGLRVTMNFLFMNLDVYLPPIPLDLLEILTRGLVERVCDGRLDEARAAELALGRATFLLTHDVYLSEEEGGPSERDLSRSALV